VLTHLSSWPMAMIVSFDPLKSDVPTDDAIFHTVYYSDTPFFVSQLRYLNTLNLQHTGVWVLGKVSVNCWCDMS